MMYRMPMTTTNQFMLNKPLSKPRRLALNKHMSTTVTTQTVTETFHKLQPVPCYVSHPIYNGHGVDFVTKTCYFEASDKQLV